MSDATAAVPRAATASAPARLRLRVTAAAERAVRAGHPWVFAESVREANHVGATGELAVIYDRQDRFLALGLFDPESPLRVRVLHVGAPVTMDTTWWSRRLENALHRRRALFDERTTGFRWINGESDGWPGLVLDRYDTTLVLKLYTAAWLPRLEEIVALLQSALRPERVVLRLSRNTQDTTRQHFRREDGQIISGPPLTGSVTFREAGLEFEADVLRGQKTGFFLDQRENRQQVAELAVGAEVLNAFSFSGGFSLHAARGGATVVTDLDISAHALEAARRNFALNRADPAIAACRHETIRTDAFDWLEKNRARKFDLIILDPPSLAKREAERAGAFAAYARLAGTGIAALRRNGVLVAASCSAHVTAEEFFETTYRVARGSSRAFEAIRTTTHPPDHPATFAEARYLKCIYLRFR